MRDRNVVFVDVARTAFGKLGGSLRDFTGAQLAAIAIRGLLVKTKILERGNVDCVFLGSSRHDSHTYQQARTATLTAGLPYDVSSTYIEMQCGSAITCINHAAWKIMCGCADVIIAGGMESYSQATCKFSMAVQPYRLIPPSPIEQRLSPNDEDCVSMLEISELMAQKWGISRESCDEFALRSQQRASRAVSNGFCRDEIIPVIFKEGIKEANGVFLEDEFVRPNTTMEGLSRLSPVLGGVTTAGNASGRNDGAAVVMMMSEERASELGYQPLARWVTGADCGVEPRFMGIGPVYSNLLALKRAGLGLNDMGVIECNEAFASQNLAVIKELECQTGKKIDLSKWNPNGGAIAFGHPNGASGARITMFCMGEMERRGERYGLISACCGGGHGVSTILENLRI